MTTLHDHDYSDDPDIGEATAKELEEIDIFCDELLHDVIDRVNNEVLVGQRAERLEDINKERNLIFRRLTRYAPSYFAELEL